MNTSHYTVVGMTCDHCVASVSEEVSEVSGVQTVEVDLATGALTVTASQVVSDAAVKTAVEAAGYQLA